MLSAEPKQAGEQLKAKRLELKLSLEIARRRTRISLKYLQALEAGNEAVFPSALYRQSFLSEYAEFLGLQLPAAPAQAAKPQPETQAPPLQEQKKQIFLTGAEPFEHETMPLETRASAARIALTLSIASIFACVWTWRNASERTWAKNFEQDRKTDRVYENFFISHLSAETARPLWARIDADGETLYEGYLPAGARKRWSAAKNFMVKLSDPSSARLLLDNRPLPDSVFKASAPVNIPVTFSGFSQNQ